MDLQLRMYTNLLINTLLKEFKHEIYRINIYNKKSLNIIHITWDDDFNGPESITITNDLYIEVDDLEVYPTSLRNYELFINKKKFNNINEFVNHIKYEQILF